MDNDDLYSPIASEISLTAKGGGGGEAEDFSGKYGEMFFGFSEYNSKNLMRMRTQAESKEVTLVNDETINSK